MVHRVEAEGAVGIEHVALDKEPALPGAPLAAEGFADGALRADLGCLVRHRSRQSGTRTQDQRLKRPLLYRLS